MKRDGIRRLSATPSLSLLRASLVSQGGRTAIERIREAGALRLRRPRGVAFDGIIVNTGGGVVGGDGLTIDFALGPGATASITSVAAEKIYRSVGPPSNIALRVRLSAGASLDWLPQETILFGGSRLRRRVAVDLDPDARLLMAETMVFGRLASAEPSIDGFLRDSWRIRRNGELIFAEESRLEGPIGAMLDRPALGGGARAAALVLLVARDAAAGLDQMQTALASLTAAGTRKRNVEAGASARDGILVARLLSPSPERLRASMVTFLGALREAPLPRIWADSDRDIPCC